MKNVGDLLGISEFRVGTKATVYLDTGTFGHLYCPSRNFEYGGHNDMRIQLQYLKSVRQRDAVSFFIRGFSKVRNLRTKILIASSSISQLN